MNKVLWIAYLVMIEAAISFAHAADAPFITLNTSSDCVTGARRISRELVIKFDADSILFSDSKGRRSYSKECITRLGMRDTLISMMDIKVFGLVHEPFALPGAAVEIRDTEDRHNLLLTTDSTGIVSIPAIPSGDYLISVVPPEDDFISTDFLITHDYDDTIYLGLEERLFSPYDIKVEQTPLYTGLTELEVNWNIGEEPGEAPFRRYRFFLEIDDNYYDETDNLHFHVDGLTPGTYTLSLFAQSGFGTFTEPINFEVKVEEVDTDFFAGICDVTSDSQNPWRYFDLNGHELNEACLSPGIYIRTNGLRREKVLIK